MRETPDVSLDADPTSGVSVYDSTRYQGQQGWFTIGGTSASSPMWAGRAAVVGAVVNAAYVYGNNITYRDITVGNNGAAPRMGTGSSWRRAGSAYRAWSASPQVASHSSAAGC